MKWVEMAESSLRHAAYVWNYLYPTLVVRFLRFSAAVHWKWTATKWLEIDPDNVRTETVKAVARLMSFAQITYFLRSKQLTDYIYTNIYCKLSKCIGQTPCSYEHYIVYSTLKPSLFQTNDMGIIGFSQSMCNIWVL